MKLGPYLSPSIKINSKWIKDLEIRKEAMQLLEEIIGSTLQHIGTGNDFLNRTLRAQEIMPRVHKWDGIKIKCFGTAKETINIKREPTE